MSTINNQWITIVLITAIIMLVFLVFYGNKAPVTSPPTALPQENKINPTKTEDVAPSTLPSKS